MRKRLGIILVAGLLLLSSCSNTDKDNSIMEKEQSSKKVNIVGNETMSYDLFMKDYENIATGFKLDGFEKIGEGELQHSCCIFPENDFFDEEKDMLDEDFNKPVKRNLYYLNKKKKVLVYITHIYSYETLEKHLLTIDVPKDEIKNEVVDGIGNFYETYMSYRNTFVSIKVFYLGEKKKQSVLDETIDAIVEYSSLLE